jgi:Tol biopolymer transport system component
MGDLKIALEDLQQESDSGRLVTQSHAPAPAASVPWPSRKRAMAAAAALALLVAMGLYWKFFWQRAAEDPRAAGRLSLLVSSEGDTFDPALSPDGKMIAYAAREGEQVDLFVSRVAGGSRVRLTNDAAREGTPAFSPDGERLAFARTASGGRTSEIWIIPALGGQATRVVADAVDPCWSPDGSRLAFVLVPPGEPAVLATAAADGSDVRKIMRGEGDYPFIRNPSWSPDGAALAVVRSSGGISGELWLVPLAGGSPKRVSSDLPGVFSNQPVFTPDGRGIVHQSNRAGATNLWLASASGGPLLRLTTGAGPDESPSVGRDGSIAFINRHTRCSLDVRDLAAGKSREIASHGWYIWAPAFSPDGSEVAFSRAEKDGAWHIWIAPLNGGSPRRLSAGALPEIYPRYTPDGEFVVYHTWSAGADRVWRIPHNGGPPEPLTPARNDDDGYADVSPDGRSIAFARTEKQRTRIYIAPIGGGDARLLVDTASTLPRWSPDGRWLAFSPSRQAFSSGIFVVGADGAGLRRVSESGGWPVWWPDGKRIGFQDLAPDGSTQVSTVAVEGGPVQHIAGVRISGTNNPFDISRDGRLLATSGCVDVSSEIWLLQTHPRRPLQ